MRAQHAAERGAMGAVTQRPRRRTTALRWLLLIVPLGLAWRTAPLHLPAFAFKYGGSMLWAAMVYWLVVLAAPWWRPVRVVCLAAVVAAAVEYGKKIRWAPLDRFRLTLMGKLLLGRYFSQGALIAYAAALLLVVVADSVSGWRRSRMPRNAEETTTRAGAGGGGFSVG